MASAVAAGVAFGTLVVTFVQWHVQDRTLQSLELEQRPWIYTTIEEKWTVHARGYFMMFSGLPISGTNTGKLPAQQASIDWELATSREPTAVKITQERVCSRAEKDATSRRLGLPIFPAQKRDFTDPHFGKSLNQEDVSKVDHIGVRGEIRSIFVVTVGCLTYFDNQRQLHQSGFAYKLQFNGTEKGINFDGDAIPVVDDDLPVALVPMNYGPLFFAN